MRPLIIPIGSKFHRLTVIASLPYDGHARRFECLCNCGRTVAVAAGSLVGGNTKSCGCLKIDSFRERVTRHGKSGTRTHRIWKNMISRCKENHVRRKDYFERGIVVCERWRASFSDFLKDMGEAPSGMSLDRINNDKGYYPGNCRWATKHQQANNSRKNCFISYMGETRTISEWARNIGKSPSTLYARRSKGWTAEQILSP